MVTNQYPLIAREGWGLVAGTAVAAVIVMSVAGFLWSLPLWLVCAVVVFLFRDPPRNIPPSPSAVVSPVDGNVISVDETFDPFLVRQAVRISIQMNPLGVYSARSPVEGKLLEPSREAGGSTRVDGQMPHGVWVQTDEQDDLVMVINRGPLKNAPRCYVGFGERVGQGQRCGFVSLGSRVDVYVPANSRIEVAQDDQVHGGADVIASLVHE